VVEGVQDIHGGPHQDGAVRRELCGWIGFNEIGTCEDPMKINELVLWDLEKSETI